MHLLNRREFERSLQHLFNSSYAFSQNLPEDNIDLGFDNFATALSANVSFVEETYRAIEKAQHFSSVSLDAEAEDMNQNGGQLYNVKYWQLDPSGQNINEVFNFPSAGNYMLRVRAFKQHSQPRTLRARIGSQTQTLSIRADEALPDVFEVQFNNISASSQTVSLEAVSSVGLIFVDYVELRKIDDPTEPTLTLSCDPHTIGATECARQVLTENVIRAWRRPVTSLEIDRLLEIVDDALNADAGFLDAVTIAFQAALYSPNFLYRVELPSNGNLTDYELLTRMSYFLWSGPPDDSLLLFAAANDLQNDENLDLAITYLLTHPNFDSFTTFFSHYTRIQELDPSSSLIRDAIQESVLFFQHLVDNRLPLEEFLNANYSFLNNQLANHYGISGVPGNSFQQVPLGTSRRKGFLTHASFLTVSSNGSETSPTHRGKIILDRFLCNDIPPPPQGVGNLTVVNPNLPKRQRLAQHATSPECAGCHTYMDPIGLGLENFDAIGAFRTHEQTPNNQLHLIDPSGQLPNGKTFATHEEMIDVILSENELASCMSGFALQYALGKRGSESEFCESEAVSQELVGRQNTIHAMIRRIIKTSSFRTRREETP